MDTDTSNEKGSELIESSPPSSSSCYGVALETQPKVSLVEELKSISFQDEISAKV